jgi:hypothetical protein
VDIGAYRQALEKYVTEAVQNSDGTHRGISGYLWDIKLSRLTLNRYEKQRALEDARHAFDDHRQWPIEVILSHLGLKPLKQNSSSKPANG